MLNIKGGMIVKNKSVILGIILVLIIMLNGIGIGYFLYKNSNKEILVEIEKNEYGECLTAKINGKNILDEIHILGDGGQQRA